MLRYIILKLNLPIPTNQFFAVIFFYLTIFNIIFAFAGLVLGIVSLDIIKKNKNQKGKYFAIIGIILSGIAFLISAYGWISFLSDPSFPFF